MNRDLLAQGLYGLGCVWVLAFKIGGFGLAVMLGCIYILGSLFVFQIGKGG